MVMTRWKASNALPAAVYYTKSAILVQGSSSKIDNLTIAQFFIVHCIETISEMVETTVSLMRLERSTNKGLHVKKRIPTYYTKCAILVQGSSSKIDNLTIVQFFILHCIETISKMVETTVSLMRLGRSTNKGLHVKKRLPTY